tara:strand:- start:17177 stop:17398 length:222 start_codon:yes stop_codon:yes gene_type:complete
MKSYRKYPIGSCVKYKNYIGGEELIGIIIGRSSVLELEIFDGKKIILVTDKLVSIFSKPYVKNDRSGYTMENS